MEIRIWDEEFKDLGKKFDKINGAFQEFDHSFYRTLARKKNIVNRCRLALERLHIRFERNNQTSGGLGKRLAALIYWTAEVSRMACDMAKDYDIYLKQFMWIRLFKIRFMGDEGSDESYLLNDSELENIAERFNSQKKMDAFLHRQHYQLRQEEKKLREAYNQLQTEEANFEAGNSLQYMWGRGAHNSQRHPTLGEVQRLFYGIGFSTKTNIKDATQLKILSREFYLKTQRLMDDCRHLMEQNDLTQSPYFDHKKVQKVRESLSQIRNLELKVDGLAHRVLPNMRQGSPILVKKKHIQVTTKR